ncbi:GNAT family protein [Pedobacter sp. KR3-3]|uniref:GNAT family protein n=1 Tax=Pedobacter albus TaxID=3113905 RepID=A0ABU7I762_9SPHI|nr:GNAT family protein [Pedobacter sp. KR3-3]MEE1945131.1 GNAT family protein [Pedobacter sp. KR3-3]
MLITGNKITLRAVENADLVHFHQWANDPDIQYMLGGWHFPTNLNDQEKWFQTLNCNSLNQRFTVTNNDGVIIGMANLVNINFKDGNAELGLIVDKRFQGLGYGKEIVLSLVKYAFNELRLNRIETTVIAYNQPSLSLFANCGWTKEGELRDWYYRKGNYHNKVVLSILHKEYATYLQDGKIYS